MDKSVLLGIDLGASNVRTGRVIAGKVVDSDIRILPVCKDYQKTLDTIFAAIDRIYNPLISGIGVGVSGMVDSKNGIVYEVQNISSWKNVPLKQIIEARYRLPTFVNNDANCFALGECLYGKGRAYQNFVGLTIGASSCGGIINAGKLLTTNNCGAGEFGEIPYMGAKYKDYCSGNFFEKTHNLSGEEIFAKAASGDSRALLIANQFGKHLGNLLKTIICSVDPEAIIIGGSLAKLHLYYHNAMFEVLKTFSYKAVADNVIIEYADNEDIPILGAAAFCVNG